MTLGMEHTTTSSHLRQKITPCLLRFHPRTTKGSQAYAHRIIPERSDAQRRARASDGRGVRVARLILPRSSLGSRRTLRGGTLAKLVDWFPASPVRPPAAAGADQRPGRAGGELVP